MTNCSCRFKSYFENEDIQGHQKFVSLPIDEDEKISGARDTNEQFNLIAR